MKIQAIHLEKIDLSDERYRISLSCPLERMTYSLKKIGLLSPPILRSFANRFVIVSGWKRIFACVALSFSSIQAFVLDDGDDLQAILISFHENLATRDLSLVEKAVALAKLKKFGLGEDIILRDYLPLLQLPPSGSTLRVMWKLAEFPQDWKEYLHEKRVPLWLVEVLENWNDEEKNLLLPILRPLSLNRQREVLEALGGICRREEISLKEILDGKDIQEIIAAQKISVVEKTERIRQVLLERRYPRYSLWKSSFEALLEKLSLPKDIRLQPSPFFESKEVSLSFSFRSPEDFKVKLSKLQEVASRKDFSQVFR